MKKFTSLFALLSCLCVVSAQADITVWVNSTNPDDQKMYWFDSNNSNPGWNNGPAINNMGEGSETINAGTFYKKTFSGYNGTMKIQFHVGETKTEVITLDEGSDYYFFYYGGTGYSALSLSGLFNDWKKISFIPTSNTVWVFDWDLSQQSDDYVLFKIRPTDNEWLGYNNISKDVPSGWIEDDKTDDHNIKFNFKSTGYTKFKLTGTYSNSSWSLKIEGVGPLNLSDNTPFPTNGGATSAESVTYSREYDKQWGTICLPFKISNTQSGITFYELSNVSETSMTFSTIDLPIAAGTPVVFKLNTAGSFEISESSTTGVALTSAAGTSTKSGWTLHGTFKQEIKDNIYFIYDDKFYHGTNITIKPYRAWFTGNGNGAPLRIEADDTQDIQFVEQEDGTVKAYYDLQGRKLDDARKGLVIENGKIIMVK